MIIGIDGNEANVKRRVGIGEYAFELLQQFERCKTYDIRFKIYLKNKPLGHMPKEREGWKYKIIGPKKMWTQLALPLNLFFSKTKPNVFFTPSHYAPRFTKVPYAISIMDLSYLYFPELFNKEDLYQLTNWTKYSVLKAKKIFTISNYSRDDIIKKYNIEPERVIVTYPGVRSVKNTENKNIDMEKFGIKGDYILFVGTLQPRKNIVRLVEAFAMLKDVRPKTKVLNLVIVGKKGWQYEEILSSPEKYGIKDRVKFLDFIEDEDLPALYKNASCFVLPSLYEGFGLPVLEAMSYGCPVLTSNVSSLPEAGGDAAIYFDPENVSDIKEKIEKVLNDPKLREEMIEKGKKQVKKFSWEKSAKETLNALQELAKNN